MKKLVSILTILNTALFATGLVGIGYAYWFVNSESGQEIIKKKLADKIAEQLPSLMGGDLPKMPSMTGPAMPKSPAPVAPKKEMRWVQ
tara:strand:- start:3967 stop:4230 length:264 start_codon:yes stop_codon:yes gene_type:complete